MESANGKLNVVAKSFKIPYTYTLFSVVIWSNFVLGTLKEKSFEHSKEKST